MPIKPAGPLSFTEIATEFGGPRPYRISQYYRGGGLVPNAPVNQRVPTSGTIKWSDFYGASKSYFISVNSNRENLNLYDLFVGTFGNPGSLPVILEVRIEGGVVIGGRGTDALRIGQFPGGSTITVNNYGSVQGFGGGRNSGTGGNALYGAYGSQAMTFNNYGSVYGGGGGGGVGGTGGTGGPGYYINTVAVGESKNVASGYGQPVLCQTAVMDCDGACRDTYGADARCENNDLGRGACTISIIDGSCLRCKRCYRDIRTDTSGGGGGGGGTGGFGQGYAQGAEGGFGGGPGAGGGTNAGTGGTGGTGGSGGGWGQYGGGGNTGETGGSGNAGGGYGGSSGAGGGAPGYYLIRGGANLAFNNYGSVAGFAG